MEVDALGDGAGEDVEDPAPLDLEGVPELAEEVLPGSDEKVLADDCGEALDGTVGEGEGDVVDGRNGGVAEAFLFLRVFLRDVAEASLRPPRLRAGPTYAEFGLLDLEEEEEEVEEVEFCDDAASAAGFSGGSLWPVLEKRAPAVFGLNVTIEVV